MGREGHYGRCGSALWQCCHAHCMCTKGHERSRHSDVTELSAPLPTGASLVGGCCEACQTPGAPHTGHSPFSGNCSSVRGAVSSAEIPLFVKYYLKLPAVPAEVDADILHFAIHIVGTGVCADDSLRAPLRKPASPAPAPISNPCHVHDPVYDLVQDLVQRRSRRYNPSSRPVLTSVLDPIYTLQSRQRSRGACGAGRGARARAGGGGGGTCKLCNDTGAGAAASCSGFDCWSCLVPPPARVGSVLTMSSCWGHATGRSACCAAALACSVAAPGAPPGLRWRWPIGRPQPGCMEARHYSSALQCTWDVCQRDAARRAALEATGQQPGLQGWVLSMHSTPGAAEKVAAAPICRLPPVAPAWRPPRVPQLRAAA